MSWKNYSEFKKIPFVVGGLFIKMYDYLNVFGIFFFLRVMQIAAAMPPVNHLSFCLHYPKLFLKRLPEHAEHPSSASPLPPPALAVVGGVSVMAV